MTTSATYYRRRRPSRKSSILQQVPRPCCVKLTTLSCPHCSLIWCTPFSIFCFGVCLPFGEKTKTNPFPLLPKSYADVVKVTSPSSLSSSVDEKEFLILHSWTNKTDLESMMVFMSDAGANMLRQASIWMMDGTFHMTSAPFYQM
jgi:hypothetical protein